MTHSGHQSRDLVGALRRLRPGAALVAIRRALPVADSPNRTLLAGLLLELLGREAAPSPAEVWGDRVLRLLGLKGPEHPAAQTVIAIWSSLAALERQAAVSILGEKGDQFATLASTSGEPGERASAAAYIADAGAVELSEILASLLQDPVPEVADAAEAAIGLLAKRMDDLLSSRPVPGAVPPAWVRALMDAARTFPRHGRRGAVLSALRLHRYSVRATRDASGLRAAMLDGPSETRQACGSALRLLEPVAQRECAVEFLWRSGLRAAAARALTSCTTAREHEAVLRAGHLLIRPARAAIASTLFPTAKSGARGGARWKGTGLLPGAEVLKHLGADARAALPAFASAVGADAPVRSEILLPLLADDEPMVRFAAAKSLPHAALADACFDPDSRVATHAINRWIGDLSAYGRGDMAKHDERLLLAMSRSPHPYLRSQAGYTLRVAGDLAGAAAGFGDADRIAAQIRSGDPVRVCAAIRLARRAGLAGAIVHDLIGLTKGSGGADAGWQRVAATAAAALGECDGAEAESALCDLLGSQDARVRANAVEALAKQRRRVNAAIPPVIHELKSDGHHRVRGAVIATLIGADQASAVDALCGLLADARPEHRAAAYWVAARTAFQLARSTGGGDEVGRALARAIPGETDGAMQWRATFAAQRVCGVVLAGPAPRIAGHTIAGQESAACVR